MASFFRIADDAFILSIKVQPNAREDAVLGVVDGLLRVRLKAPAIEGRANAASCRLLADRLGAPKSQVQVLKGTTGRLKQVRVQGARRGPDSLLEPAKSR